MKRISLWVAIAAITVAAGCTDSNYHATAPAVVALTGVYAGSVSGMAASVPYSSGLTYSLTQSGNAVSGSWSTVMGNAGTLNGTITGSAVAFTVVQVTPCTGSVSGTATIANAGNTLAGSYAGTMCGQTLSATFSVTRP